MQSTETADVNAALLYKLQFLQRLKENPEEVEIAEKVEDLGKLPLKEVAERYFNWKRAKSSDQTLARERRLFKRVLKFFGPNQRVKAIQLPLIQKYQGERCMEKSPTMKRRVCARTINYELQLLRGCLKHAGCWADTLEANYEPLPQRKSDIGQAASVEQLKQIILKARAQESWAVAICCAAVAMGTGCRGGEIRKLQIQDIRLEEERIVIRKENAKNGKQREPRLTGLAAWGLRNLLLRAKALGATEPTHYLLPLNLKKSRILAKTSESKWDVTRPMTTWVKSWRKLIKECGMQGFRFHDLRHSFRTIGAEAGVPLEVMMTQVGHMDRQTSLDYVHIQQRALERAKTQIETHQAEILAATETLLLADNACSFLPAQ
jgi:integrase